MALKSLILIPTSKERDVLHSVFPESKNWELEIVGFGMVESAIQTARLVSHDHGTRFILAGLAGTYEESTEIGKAYEFSSVVQYGIGVGSGTEFRGAQEMGFSQVDIPSAIRLATFDANDERLERVLLTTALCSENESDRDNRVAKYPNASAEDMESYSVASACFLAGVSLHVVRGISNSVGDRQHANWQIEKAMCSVGELINNVLEREKA